MPFGGPEVLATYPELTHAAEMPVVDTACAALLALAAVVWVPHWPDGGAGLAREAAAAGVPAVAVRRPDLAEVIADGSTGLLLGRARHVEWATATLGLLADESRRRQLGGAARRRARDLFDPGRFAAALAGLYNRTA